MASGIPGAFVGLNLIKQCALNLHTQYQRDWILCEYAMYMLQITLLIYYVKVYEKNHGLQLLDFETFDGFGWK